MWATQVVKQTRYSFLWEQQVFIIIQHEGGDEPVYTLRRQAGVRPLYIPLSLNL
jgi:hypothetical protein